MLEELTFQFSDESNKEKLSQMIMSWLEHDFNSQKQRLGKNPEEHFWYNIDEVARTSRKEDTLVLSNAQGLVGYLIWSVKNPHYACLDFIEVSSEYRGKGVGRRMITALQQHLPEVYLLSAMSSNTPTAKNFYQRLGWRNNGKTNNFYKIIRPGLESSQILPTTGLVLSICPFDFYEVHNNLKQYLPRIQYFKLEMGSDGKLLLPIISEFKAEGYIGIYHDGQLIESGKTKHLFENGALDLYGYDLFLMVKFNPLDKKKYESLLANDRTSPNACPNDVPTTLAIAGRAVRFFRERDSEEPIVQAVRLQPRGQ